jgi:hypothetical protein
MVYMCATVLLYNLNVPELNSFFSEQKEEKKNESRKQI